MTHGTSNEKVIEGALLFCHYSMCMWSLLTFWPQCIFVFIVGYFDLRVDSMRAIQIQQWKFFESMLWELGNFFF